MALGLETFESLFCYLAAIHSQSYLGSQDCTAINKVFNGFHFVVTNSIKLSQRKKICLIKKLGSTNAYNNYIEETFIYMLNKINSFKYYGLQTSGSCYNRKRSILLLFCLLCFNQFFAIS